MSFDNEASYLIDSIYIENLWGKYNISTKLDKDVNIFIGINGSYKTTLIKLIYNLLTLDFAKLIDIDFDSIKLKLRNGRSTKTILFSKILTESGYKKYVFEIKGIKKISLSERDIRISGRFIYDNYEEDFDAGFRINNSQSSTLKSKYIPIKAELSKLINIDYLNINRYSINKSRAYFDDSEKYSIEYEIKKLVNNFIRYQSEVKTAINNCSNNFLKKAFIVLLKEDVSKIFNGKLTISSKDLEDYKKLLTKMSKDEAYVAMETITLKNRLDEIYVIIDKVMKNLLPIQAQKRVKKSISIEDIMRSLEQDEFLTLINNFPFLAKIQALLELYKVTEKEKQEYERPTKLFIEISNAFLKSTLFPQKKLIITEDGSLMLQIDESHIVDLRSLSSGEKQLLILLLRTLLQKNKKGVYITDEPELSLHINWQEKLIDALKKINSNIQLILATHSPDIVSKFNNNIIQMEDILSNG